MAMGIDELRIAVQTLRPLAAEAQRLERELASIRGDIVEHVMDGREFDWIEAVIAIRAWREAAEGLQALVDKLPKDAEGGPVVPDVPIYHPDGRVFRPIMLGGLPFNASYPTREAAEAAREKRDA